MQKDVPTATGSHDFPIPDAPKWSLDGTTSYRWNVFDGALSLMAHSAYVSRRTVTAITFRDTEVPSYTHFDVRLTYTPGRGRWSATAFVDNLTNESIEVIQVPSAGLVGANLTLYDRPRWYGVSVTAHY